ncbi:RICIN domain-containing protein [Streptomyces sp. H39-S7]|uniref:RICIN domain-containing protein n=1 Tax=Streptomyces sp. H39-S7 TaxID=3004357 RepID=UPI0022AE5620|nr:RICIN domain-containing protein [Streptomyces sp. H39-S7]MCZ4121538.1 RICIN domain-containing protein [Streptomyces sp. H39-S7]
MRSRLKYRLGLLAAATGIAALILPGTASADAQADSYLWHSLAASHKCVGLANNGSTANGTALVIWDCHGHPDQRWTSGPSGGASAFYSQAGANKCVGLANNGSTANGTPLVIWDCHGHPDQQWYASVNNSLRSNAAVNKCIGLANNGSTANGTPLVIWDCHGHPDQQWQWQTGL